MNHTFTHRGRQHTLIKHPSVGARLRAGEITSEQAAATPWYLRMAWQGRRRIRTTGTASVPEAVRTAKSWLTRRADQPDKFSAALEATSHTGTTTIAALAERWVAAGMPDTSNRPRGDRQQAGLRHFLEMALRWWGPRTIGSLSRRDLLIYAGHRRQTTRHGTGERSTDLELLTLSHVCRWAMAMEMIEANPFENRPRFRAHTDVAHAHQHMPPTTDAHHAMLAQLLGADDPARVVAGAHLVFCSLTGLRPGEPGALRLTANPGTRLASNLDTPAGAHPPGEVYTITNADGQEATRLAIRRSKSGQNPAVAVHPALEDFLATWREWLRARIPDSPWWFPAPLDPMRPLVPFGTAVTNTSLGPWLRQAAEHVGAGHVTPHGMRAVYVRVRRSEGSDDLTISQELGQGSGPDLIRRVYGDPQGIVGDGRFTWVPRGAPPCWVNLSNSAPTCAAPPANVVAL